MKKKRPRSGYYVPSSAADDFAFAQQFGPKNKPTDTRGHTPLNDLDENPIHFPAIRGVLGFSFDLRQGILKPPRQYPCTLEVFNQEKQAVASRRINSRDSLDASLGWYWIKSTHMKLGYRFTAANT